MIPALAGKLTGVVPGDRVILEDRLKSGVRRSRATIRSVESREGYDYVSYVADDPNWGSWGCARLGEDKPYGMRLVRIFASAYRRV